MIQYIYYILTYLLSCPAGLSWGRTSLGLRQHPARQSIAVRGWPPPRGWTIGPRVSEKCGSSYRRTDVWCCGHAIYIMDKVEMDEMKGLFCIDILVTLEISPTIYNIYIFFIIYSYRYIRTWSNNSTIFLVIFLQYNAMLSVYVSSFSVYFRMATLLCTSLQRRIRWILLDSSSSTAPSRTLSLRTATHLSIWPLRRDTQRLRSCWSRTRPMSTARLSPVWHRCTSPRRRIRCRWLRYSWKTRRRLIHRRKLDTHHCTLRATLDRYYKLQTCEHTLQSIQFTGLGRCYLKLKLNLSLIRRVSLIFLVMSELELAILNDTALKDLTIFEQ